MPWVWESSARHPRPGWGCSAGAARGFQSIGIHHSGWVLWDSLCHAKVSSWQGNDSAALWVDEIRPVPAAGSGSLLYFSCIVRWIVPQEGPCLLIIAWTPIQGTYLPCTHIHVLN